MFLVLKQWLLLQRETEASFVYIIYTVGSLHWIVKLLPSELWFDKYQNVKQQHLCVFNQGVFNFAPADEYYVHKDVLKYHSITLHTNAYTTTYTRA